MGTALIRGSGEVVESPASRDLAREVGIDLGGVPAESRCDLLVVGAGPSGLASAVYAASEGLDVMIIEDVSLGGQAGSSSRIENYLGFPAGISGTELGRAAMIQAVKFGARILSPRTVTALARRADGLVVELDGEHQVSARSVVVASGVRYRRLPVPGVAELDGRGVYYAATEREARAVEGQVVVVVGGANSAGQAALFLARRARHVHVLIRREDLRQTMSSYLSDRLLNDDHITVHGRSELVAAIGEERLNRVAWSEPGAPDPGARRVVQVDAGGLFLMIGAEPRTEWLRNSGVEVDAKGFVVTGEAYATSVPGVFAVGDVRAGSVKRVASAVGEGSVVVSAIHAYLGRDG